MSFRFTGTIAKGASIRKCKSYRGRPSSRQEELELDERDQAELSRRLNGLPLCYNHDDNDVVGRIEGNSRQDNGDWDVAASLSLDTPRNRELKAWIEAGMLKGLSLKHRLNTNEPLEVSLCFRGARPGTTIKKIMQYDSNSQLYNLASAEEDGYTVLASDENQTDADLIIIAASVTAMSTSEPPAAAAAPTTDKEDEEMKEAEAVFTDTAKVTSILQSVHGIPSKAQREELAGIASKLELEKLELAEKNKAMEEQIKKHAEELERVRKEAEGKAKALYEAEQQISTQRNLAGDLIKTLGDGKDDKAVNEVLASMGPAATKFFAERGREFVAASAALPPSSSSEVVESEVRRNMLRWLASKKKKALLRTEERKELSDEESPSETPPPADKMSYRDLLEPVVKASWQKPADWGAPIRFRQPQQRTGRVVAASMSSFPDDQPSSEYDPGEGPCFEHGWMLSPAQIDIYRSAPSHEEAGSRLNIVQAGYSSEYISMHRKACMMSDAANKRKALSDEARMMAEHARVLRSGSALPTY